MIEEVLKMSNRQNKSYLTLHNAVYAAGYLLMVIACFMPYVYSDEKNMTLMEGNDGIFFLICAMLAAIYIVYDKKKVVGVLSVITVYLGAYELAHTYGIMTKTGKAVAIRAGYYVLLAGTVIVLVAAAYFIYIHGLKDGINRLFEKIFPVKRKEK